VSSRRVLLSPLVLRRLGLAPAAHRATDQTMPYRAASYPRAGDRPPSGTLPLCLSIRSWPGCVAGSYQSLSQHRLVTPCVAAYACGRRPSRAMLTDAGGPPGACRSRGCSSGAEQAPFKRRVVGSNPTSLTPRASSTALLPAILPYLLPFDPRRLSIAQEDNERR